MNMLLLTARAMIAQTVTRGKIVVLALLTLASLAIAFVISTAGFDSPSQTDAATSTAGIVFVFVVPMVSLVFATGGLGDSHHDGTLVYLWLRPTRRLPIAAGAWLAAALVSLPFNLASATGSILILEGNASLATASALAAILATFTYTAVFSVFGLLVRNSITWGLAYILVWEGAIANFGTLPARLALRGYSTSILASGLDDHRDFADNVGKTVAFGTTVVVLVFVVAAALAVSTWLLNQLDIE